MHWREAKAAAQQQAEHTAAERGFGRHRATVTLSAGQAGCAALFVGLVLLLHLFDGGLVITRAAAPGPLLAGDHPGRANDPRHVREQQPALDLPRWLCPARAGLAN